MFFLPIVLGFIIFYFLIAGGLFLLVKLGFITLAFEKLGIPSDAVFVLLLLTLIGSAINIPLKRIPGERATAGELVEFFGWRFRIPAAGRQSGTVIAVNLGGAIIPAALCFYLFYRWPGIIWADLIGVAVVALIVHRTARAVKGVGITTPALLPPIVAAAAALLLARISGQSSASVIAYVGGTLGTLIGADLTNLKKIAGLGAPVASIGGAGTFDGVFLTGVIAVLLASL